MGCGCSIADEQAVSAPPTGPGRGTGNPRITQKRLEFSDIAIRGNDPNEPKAVYCPPPPDWALNDHGVERKAGNLQRIQARMAAPNGDASNHRHHRNPWLQLISDAKAAAEVEKTAVEVEANHKTQSGPEDPDAADSPDTPQNEDANTLKDEIVVEVNPDADTGEAVDALSRPRSIQSIPATLSDPGPLTLEDVGHKVPFNHSRKMHRHSQQLAVDEPFGHYYGQYSTLV